MPPLGNAGGAILGSISNGARMIRVRNHSFMPCLIWFSQALSTCALLLTLASAPFNAAAQDSSPHSSNQTATIHGVVLNTVDQKPIPGAIVTLMNSRRTMPTDDKGQFSFGGVPFGSESVSVKKPGFLCLLMRSGQQPKCFQQVDLFANDIQVALTMTPQAIVSGRIVDQTGKPVDDLHLNLLQKQNIDGRNTWSVLGQTFTTTSAEGIFRIANLEPGNYLIQSLNSIDPQQGAGDADHGYAATFFPGTTNLSDAKPIRVQPGEEFKADLIVRHEEFQLVTVSFAWDHPWAPGLPAFGLSSFGNQDYLSSMWDDTHRLIRVYLPPGNFRIGFAINPPTDPKNGELLPWPDGTKAPYIGSVEFTVKDQPLALTGIPSQQPITILLKIDAELTQQEKLKTAQSQYPYRAPQVSFDLSNGRPESNHHVSWQADRGPTDLALKDVPPGRYTLVTSASRGAYVASLTCGGINLFREPLVVGPGIPICSIQAVVRDDHSSLDVGFTPAAIDQMTAANATVTDLALIPVEDLLDLPYSAGIWRDSAPRELAIPPGTYLAFLFDGRAIAWRDPDVRKQLMSFGTVVTLAPGESKALLLDWRPELNASEAKGVALGRVLP